jgi:hypothetical protein
LWRFFFAISVETISLRSLCVANMQRIHIKRKQINTHSSTLSPVSNPFIRQFYVRWKLNSMYVYTALQHIHRLIIYIDSNIERKPTHETFA